MKKLDDVSLADLATEVEAEEKRVQIDKARAGLKGMLVAIDGHEANLRKLTEQATAEQKKLDTARIRYEKAKAGDWSVISDKPEGKDDTKDPTAKDPTRNKE